MIHKDDENNTNDKDYVLKHLVAAKIMKLNVYGLLQRISSEIASICYYSPKSSGLTGKFFISSSSVIDNLDKEEYHF